MALSEIPAEEQRLVERLKAGDKSACAQCVELHADGIYRVALRLMRDEREAEDILQETLLSAFKGIQSFDGRARLHTWLFRIATNAALMRLRRREPVLVPVDEPVEEDDVSGLPRQLADWSGLPERVYDDATTRAELDRAIAALPQKLREVFVLRELEELSTEETAQALAVSAQVVKTRLHRARLWLRERLADYFTEFALPA